MKGKRTWWCGGGARRSGQVRLYGKWRLVLVRSFMGNTKSLLYSIICDFPGNDFAFEDFWVDVEVVERITGRKVSPLRSRSEEYTDESKEADGGDDED